MVKGINQSSNESKNVRHDENIAKQLIEEEKEGTSEFQFATESGGSCANRYVDMHKFLTEECPLLFPTIRNNTDVRSRSPARHH